MRKLHPLLSIFLALAFALSACGQPATPVADQPTEPAAPSKATQPLATEQPGTPAEPVSKFQESPMLVDMVKAGSLPPVDERLPENPRVIEPFKEVGKYGGQMEFGFTGGSAAWGGMLYLAGWENLTSWRPDFSGVEPNILASLEANADSSVWTATLRKGMKWSDGEPFTADDIAFYVQDILMDPDLSPAGFGADWCPSDMAADFKFEKVDDYTVKFTLCRPDPAFLSKIAFSPFAIYPSEWLEKTAGSGSRTSRCCRPATGR